jgi:hypothetical protein
VKKLSIDAFIGGHEVDNSNMERLEVLTVHFREKARQLLHARRGTGGKFRITLEWTPEPKPKEDK